MSRYRFVLTPKWILRHLFVLAMVVTMINLGFWQLRRLDGRRERNAQIESRTALAVVSLDELVSSRALPSDPEVASARDRRVTATGVYDLNGEVLIANRSHRGTAGYEILTPLRISDGSVVAVDRGWVPLDIPNERPLLATRPPVGTVTVTGIVSLSERAAALEGNDRATGQLAQLRRVDLDRFQQQIDADLYPVWVRLEQQSPANAGTLPFPADGPVLGEGPHFSYAIQWFVFAAMTIGGWPLLIRRSAQQREKRMRLADRQRAALAVEAEAGPVTVDTRAPEASHP